MVPRDYGGEAPSLEELNGTLQFMCDEVFCEPWFSDSHAVSLTFDEVGVPLNECIKTHGVSFVLFTPLSSGLTWNLIPCIHLMLLVIVSKEIKLMI